MKRAALAIPCLLFIGACSSGDPAVNTSPTTGNDSTTTTTQASSTDSSVTTSAPTTTEEPAPENATAIAEGLGVASIQKVVTVTEDNDPNDKIGRPNGYTSAAVIYDSTVADCGDDLGVDCGATIEVFATPEAAKERSEYIQGLQKDAPMLGSEYNYLNGPALLRVSGDIKPTVAAEYEAAFAM